MHTKWFASLASLVVIGCALPQQEPTGSSGEALDIAVRQAPSKVSLMKMMAPESAPEVTRACSMPPGWIASSATFDAQVAPLFASEIDPLLAARPAITIGALEGSDGQWTMRASATITKGALQVFPPEHPTMPSNAIMSASGFVTSTPITSAWVAVIDASSTLVWIPLVDVAVQGSFVTGDCTHVSGVVDARVPVEAGSIPIVTMEAQRTLGELLRAGTDDAPEAGWHVRFTFTASPTAIEL